MAIVPDEIRYRGNYRQYDTRGYAVVYSVGDVVVYDGKQYVAIENNVKSIPTKKDSGWKIYTGNFEDYFYSDDVPLNVNVGDRWIDRVSGRMYTYIEDKNGFHWVEF
jgi:hypothetical protein